MGFLVRRREVWLPTAWGWLLLAGTVAAAVVALALGLPGLLSPNEPALAGGRGAGTLVVEGWIGRGDLDQAVLAFGRGRYERVLATGGPIEADSGFVPWATYAERAAGYLRARSLGVPVVAVPTAATLTDRTFASAIEVRDWAGRNGVRLNAIDVFSAGVHTRRSRRVYQLALGPAVEVGALASRPAAADDRRWWQSSEATKTVLTEALALGWTTCCFWPAIPAASSAANRAAPAADSATAPAVLPSGSGARTGA